MRCAGFLLTLSVATAGNVFPLVAVDSGLVDRHVGVLSPPTVDNRIRDNLYHHNALLSRDAAPKQPSPICPEDIGAEPLPCSADVCGGADPKNAGHCTKERCRCAKDSTATPVLTTITASQSGKTVTGSYALQTISSYTDLRQAITTTVTTNTTGTDGSIGVETGAAVVFAGGVAWFLSGFVGDASIAEASLEAPDTDPDHKDDPKCPSQKQKCAKCQGRSEICTTGDDSGCACESASCPTRDQEPKCSDPKCKGGNDNKCTVENQGCTCGEDVKCPEELDTLFCEDCGGADKERRCKGLSSENGKWQGCDCIIFGDEGTPYTPYSNAEEQALVGSFAGIGTIKDSSYANDPLNGDPVCLKLGLGAPQRDEDAHDGQPSVTKSINEWCAEVDGNSVTKSNTTIFQYYPTGNDRYWLSAEYWFQSTDSSCGGNTRKVTKDECQKTLITSMQECDPESKTSHGASLVGQCIKYNITVAPYNPDKRPPWKPVPADASPVCEKRYSIVQENFFSGLYPVFCDAVNKGDKTKPLKQTLHSSDFHASQKRSLDTRTPPANPDDYSEYQFFFDWTGVSDAKQDCYKNCMLAYEYISASPCGLAGMAYKASVGVGCGKYSYTISSETRQCGIDPSFLEGTTMVPWNVDYAKQAIDEFCTDTKDNFLVDPATPQPPPPPTTFTQGKGSYPSQIYRYGDNRTHDTSIFVQFSQNAKNGCSQSEKFLISDHSDRCSKLLTQVLEDPGPCPGNTGGNVKEKGQDYGCVTWQMFQYSVE